MIHVTIQPDSSGYVHLPGEPAAIAAPSLAEARERAITILAAHAELVGRPLEVRATDVGETHTMTVHPDGHVEVMHTAPNIVAPAPEIPAPVRVEEATTDPPRRQEPTGRPDATAVFRLENGHILRVETAMIFGRAPQPWDGLPEALPMPFPATTNSVSKSHCAIEPGPEGVTVTDLGATNGTDIRRSETTLHLTPFTPTKLVDEDVVYLGDDFFTVHLHPEDRQDG